MRIAVCTIAYNEPEYIVPCIRQWRGQVEKHVVLVSTLPWNGTPIGEDITADLARKNGADVVMRHWESEAEQRNWGLAYLYDYDFVLIVDPDEFYTKNDREEILKRLNDPLDYINRTGRRVPHFVPRRIATYWKTSEYRLQPENKHKPTIAVDPKQVRFREHRDCQPRDGGQLFIDLSDVIEVVCHHMSWVHSDQKIAEKISSYSHAGAINPNWYQDVWKQWQPGSDAVVRPYGAEKSKAVYDPAPDEIKKLCTD